MQSYKYTLHYACLFLDWRNRILTAAKKIRLKYQPNSHLWATLDWFSMHSWFSKYYYVITTILAYWQKCIQTNSSVNLQHGLKWLVGLIELSRYSCMVNATIQPTNSPRNLLHRFSFQSFKDRLFLPSSTLQEFD